MVSFWLLLIINVLLPNNNPPILDSDFIQSDMDYLIEFYKERHQHPELSLQEEKTSASLTSELEQLGYEVTSNYGGYGVVGILKNGNGPQILYRTDMDLSLIHI